MTLSSDLTGLGVAPLVAARTATAGIGPVTITAAGTTFATATRIGCAQFLVSTTTTGNLSLSLPPVGGDNGALLGDDFIINNATTGSSLTIFGSTSVQISIAGSNTSSCSLSSHQTLTCYPVSTTQWVGVKGL